MGPCWPAAFATSLLFNVGKAAISLYIGSQGLESTYGAAASIVVLLIWVYYSSQIVLFGAEISRALADRHQTSNPRWCIGRLDKSRAWNGNEYNDDGREDG